MDEFPLLLFFFFCLQTSFHSSKYYTTIFISLGVCVCVCFFLFVCCCCCYCCPEKKLDHQNLGCPRPENLNFFFFPAVVWPPALVLHYPLWKNEEWRMKNEEWERMQRKLPLLFSSCPLFSLFLSREICGVDSLVIWYFECSKREGTWEGKKKEDWKKKDSSGNNGQGFFGFLGSVALIIPTWLPIAFVKEATAAATGQKEEFNFFLVIVLVFALAELLPQALRLPSCFWSEL